eukprot:1275003-Rhodomonas_salina.1
MDAMRRELHLLSRKARDSPKKSPARFGLNRDFVNHSQFCWKVDSGATGPGTTLLEVRSTRELVSKSSGGPGGDEPLHSEGAVHSLSTFEALVWNLNLRVPGYPGTAAAKSILGYPGTPSTRVPGYPGTGQGKNLPDPGAWPEYWLTGYYYD